MSRKYLPGILAALALLVAAAWYMHRLTIPVLEPKGPVALGELHVMLLTTLLCALIVIPVFVLLFFFAWRYRADAPGAATRHAPNWDHDNAFAEALWWVAPTVIIIVLAILAVRSSHAFDPYRPLVSSAPAITVEVVALDWKWLFIYPAQGIASVNLLEFPVNVPVHFELTADAPMNSFWIPQLGGQIMVMPGMSTQLNLMASSLGDFNGSSANISGDGFAGMQFAARAVSQSDFDTWVSIAQQLGPPLTSSSYAALAAPSEYNPITFYSVPDTSLYTHIIDDFMMPQQPAGESQASATSSAPAMSGMGSMTMP